MKINKELENLAMQGPDNFQKLLSQDDKIAQCLKGVLEEDGKEKIKWFTLSANQGYAEVQFELGAIYQAGRCGINEDPVEAEKWLLKAANQNHMDAQFMLGTLYGNANSIKANEHEAVKWYRKAAEQGQAEAQYNMALRYQSGRAYNGGRGIYNRLEYAVEWHNQPTGNKQEY